VWAAVGLVWLAVCVRAVGGWVLSGSFHAVPVLGPDVLSTPKLIGLRVLEVLSVAVLLGSGWFMAIRPWRRSGRVPLTALLFVGGLCAFFMDSWLNLYGYLFAFNSRSVNAGTWVRYLPFDKQSSPAGFGEALLWGLPMYIYFCCGLGAVGATAARRILSRRPSWSLASTFVAVWVGFFVFDLVVENLIMRTTDAYAFVRTDGALTLWSGSVHQFPIYESILVATMALLFAWVQLSADWSPTGETFIEVGVQEIPRALQTPARTLAAIGFCAVAMFAYHLPYNWISIGGTSVAHLPSYLQAR
jgi:hypothetical protein